MGSRSRRRTLGPDGGGGHGLAGLRERVSLVGGSVDSGPRTGGGFVVRTSARGERMTTRVLIADDQALVRDGFRMILEAEEDFEVVGEAADGLEAVLAARETNPDVILMDVRMPKVDGLQATRKLLERNDTGARILILRRSTSTSTSSRPSARGRAGFSEGHAAGGARRVDPHGRGRRRAAVARRDVPDRGRVREHAER